MTNAIKVCLLVLLIFSPLGMYLVPAAFILNKEGEFVSSIFACVLSLIMSVISFSIFGLSSYIKQKLDESYYGNVLVAVTQFVQTILYTAVGVLGISNLNNNSYNSWLINAILSGIAACITLFDFGITWRYIYLPYKEHLKINDKRKFAEEEKMSNLSSFISVMQPCEKEIVEQNYFHSTGIAEENNQKFVPEITNLSELTNLSDLIASNQTSEKYLLPPVREYSDNSRLSKYYKNTSEYSFEDNLLP